MCRFVSGGLIEWRAFVANKMDCFSLRLDFHIFTALITVIKETFITFFKCWKNENWCPHASSSLNYPIIWVSIVLIWRIKWIGMFDDLIYENIIDCSLLLIIHIKEACIVSKYVTHMLGKWTLICPCTAIICHCCVDFYALETLIYHKGDKKTKYVDPSRNVQIRQLPVV